MKTEVRDSVSKENRGATDEAFRDGYRYTENTGFKTIIDHPTESAFFSNYLWYQSKFGRYFNKNPEWSSCYTATLIVPLTLSANSENITGDNILGFTCIDNKGGGFDDASAMTLLQSVARSFYFILSTVSNLPRTGTSGESNRS